VVKALDRGGRWLVGAGGCLACAGWGEHFAFPKRAGSSFCSLSSFSGEYLLGFHRLGWVVVGVHGLGWRLMISVHLDRRRLGARGMVDSAAIAKARP